MRTGISFLLSLFACFTVFNLQAEEAPKKFNIGIGTYAMTIAYTDSFFIDDDFIGSSFNASYAISNNIAIRGNLYSMTHDDFSSLDVDGVDIAMLFGSGLENLGFKAYLGGGIFNEDWKALGATESFSGLQLNGGIGYNWDAVSLDFMLGIRETSDYEDFLGADAASVSSSLSLSLRF
ncbi:MAG: hypothetical protein DIZ80_05365 [endosymbiont of Galathealinum brachiosum]|uniref:Outer membrane protein beta-barrel domain-containing protein n=1 Tax=endosymbiont of Galathealinum brachiosum TaxID=2200906 RepID=A0A370DJ04_9GAMM|nr:MAG: hypothetical protein DIZ80_05365 [endosymbiont of Galathealinum brachiosum]